MFFNKKGFITFALISILVVCMCSGCGKKSASSDLIELHGRTMGTTYMVKITLPPHQDPGKTKELNDRVAAGIEDLLKTVNQQMSTWLEDSEISRFNRFQETDWFGVSPDTVRVVAEALNTSAKSNGAFDITVGPLVNLWGFGPQKDGVPFNTQVPPEEQIQEVMGKIGYLNLSVRLSPPALRKQIPAIYCDLSAIAKGFGVDKTGEYIESRGFNAYLVEIGGEVRARGTRPDGQPWHVAVASPGQGGPGGNSPYQKVILLKNTAMATSGDYFNYFEKDGVRYSHTIDPTTGRPITHKLASVSVIHHSCMTADAMATAIDVLGPDKGFELALKENLPVFMIIRDKDKFVEKMTPGFEELLK